MRVLIALLFVAAGLRAEDPLPHTRIGWLLRFTPREELDDPRLQARARQALRQLDDPSPELRDQAEQSLIALGGAALPQLAELLASEPEPELCFRLLHLVDRLWREPPAAAFPDTWEKQPLRDQGDYRIEPCGEVGPLDGSFRVLAADAREAWAFAGHSQQSWCVRADRLYLAVFDPISSGCEVLAVDLSSGEPLWRTVLQGLGPIAHSEYFNSVHLLEADGELVILGNEAAGRYYEALAVEDGRQLFHRLVP